jgi:Diacylglycerol kinase accessory domain/Diacylglycerol kinase catalytic domain
VIACGGDGTTIWVIEELIKARVDISSIVVSVLPLGTGNDFSIATGFGGSIWLKSETLPSSMINSPLDGLKQCIADYLLGEVRPIDIWDIEIVCMPEVGCIKEIITENGKKVKKPKTTTKKSTGESVVSSSFCRKMSNYCSIGVDARIGLGFDRSRSTNRILNKLVYAWEGIKKFVRPAMNMHNIIEKMENLESFEKIEQRACPEEFNELELNEGVSARKVPSQIVQNNTLDSSKSNGVFNFANQQVAHIPEHSQNQYSNHYDGTNKFNPSGVEYSQQFRNPDIGRLYCHGPVYPPPQNTNLIHTPTQALYKQQTAPLQQPLRLAIKSNTEAYTSRTTTKTEETVINGYRITTREIFRTGTKKDCTLMISPINIIGLNIPSYMGGIANMWDKASQNAPIKSADGNVKLTNKQDMGDGELEFLSFTGNLRFGVFERLITGGGKRVAQGAGPFLITFKKSEDPVNKPLVTYAQIDGEYMQLINPLYYRVGLTPDLPNGKINGLFKKSNKK